MIFRLTFSLMILLGCPIFAATEENEDGSRISFSRDIRPILSDNCFKCHGPDEGQRQTDLRLDQRTSVFDETEVVVPGQPDASELFGRLVSEDTDMLMPPPDSGKELDKAQIETFRQWIKEGAQWGEHWAFVPPAPRGKLNSSESSWIQNEIDYFVLQQQTQRGLAPSASANRQTLVRRLFLDLTGLPPEPTQVDEFLNDPSPQAYEKLVDRLLASSQYGEHMARHWLDVVRYGDTHGLHLDNYREIWAYRDWIINAFNKNQPFDEFSIEQLAGDLLENPTRQQLIATGFNRAHVTTNEGGSIEEEVLIRNVIDRVSTMGTVYLGLTIGCAQCHDHKFDPISQKEFYEMSAYFNSIDGPPMDGNKKDHEPVLMVSTPEQADQLAAYDDKIKWIRNDIKSKVAEWNYIEPDDPPTVFPDPIDEIWIDDELPASESRHGKWTKIDSSKVEPQSGKFAFENQAVEFTQLVIQKVTSPWTVNEGDELFAYAYLDPKNPPREIMLQWNDGNWEHRVYWGENLINFGKNATPSRKHLGSLPRPGNWVRLSVPAAQVNLKAGQKINGVAVSQFGGRVFWDSIGRVTRKPPFPANRSLADWKLDIVKNKGGGLPGDLKKVAEKEPKSWNDQEHRQLRDYFIENVYSGSRTVFDPLHETLNSITKQRNELSAKIPTTLIYRERAEPRPAYFLKRGQYDQRGDQVSRRVPSIFEPLPKGAPNNRLGLARWLFTGDHPLTARVAVNRFWQQLFGQGIVETSEDFGAQGQFPSHPDLLDHLASEFVNHDWDVKWLIKQMVMSATYRQSSRVSPEALKVDPQNRWLARGPRYRLDAEVLRDQALAVSGLLVRTIGGPSVKPPQPDGLWFAVGYSGSNTVRFKKDAGHEKVHRRSMYTFWKRTAPPPQMSIFDAPSRESCIVRRERTNTPLQALMLMNDPQYVEAARYLGQRLIDQKKNDDSIQTLVNRLFRVCLSRSPDKSELSIVADAFRNYEREFSKTKGQASRLVEIGEDKVDDKYDSVELAAWTMVANLIMNMDEFVTKN